ncbi:uncharacterized protein LOC143905409 isoform X2 [Temnothorax americanus]|uniref:uncharacterized protein LOC143905409 isoform X2 n=1 Tax=Temnothorax americanus TaxID=1964332 RepID=UPI004068C12E
MEKSSCIKSTIEKHNKMESDSEESLDALCKNVENLSKSTMNIKRKKGMNWTEKETNYFIQLCIEKRILKLMDGKKYKHIDVYKSLEPSMKQAGFVKSGEQMQLKMKHLKELYYRCKRNNSTSGHNRMSFQYFEAMDELLGSRPSVQAVDGVGIESSSASETQEIEIIGTESDTEFLAKDVIVEMLDAPLAISDKNRKGGRKTGGRLSNIQRGEQFSETFVKKQAEMFHEIFTTQNQLLNKSLQEQMEEQRKWEAEIMKKEHDHQMQQMGMLMDGFLKGLQTIQQQQYQPSFYPTVQSSVYSSLTPSMSPQTLKTFVPPASPSPSATSDYTTSLPSSSLEIPSNHELQVSSPVPQNRYFVQPLYSSQTSPATDKLTK